MLHSNNRERLIRHCPESVDMEWRNPITGNYVTSTIDVNPYWMERELEPQYPAVAFQLVQEGVPRGSFGGEMGDDTYKEDVPNDDSIAYIKLSGKPVYAELNITVAVKQSHGGIPEDVVADKIAEEVYYQYRHNSGHFEEHGVNADGTLADYEWPMAVTQRGGDGITTNNGMIDEQAVQRRQMIFRIDYRYWREEEIEAVDKVEYQLETDVDGDGDTDHTTVTRVVDLTPNDG